VAAKKPEGEEKKKGGKLKLIILLVVLLAVLGGGGFAAWKFFLQPKMAGGGNQTEAPQEEAAAKRGEEGGKKEGEGKGGEAGKAVGGPQLVKLETLVVNLSDPTGRRYLKATMEVEMANAAAAADLNANMPKIKDMLLMLLSSKTYADIATMDKKLELKNEIVDRLNLVVGKAKIKGVYFTDFVVQ